MGARKKLAAQKRKEALKTQYFAKLQNVPSSPRKMRYVVRHGSRYGSESRTRHA